MSLDSLYLERARGAVRQSQNPSVSALQSTLRIGHTFACDLIERLQVEGMLLTPMDGRQPGVHPDYRRDVVRRIGNNDRLRYVCLVVQAALLCFELDEETSDGDSAVLKLHVPLGVPWKVLRLLFLKEWYGKQGLSLTSAALAFHDWLRERGFAPVDCYDVLSETIVSECLPYERSRQTVTAPADRLARAYIRLARYYLRSLSEGGSRHTRIAQYYVRDKVVPQNLRLSADQHPEHVVPCAVLRDTAATAFEAGASVRDVADWIERRMLVVWIAKSDARRLDCELDLKDRMSPQWNTSIGCPYERLHIGCITFTPASSHPCTCPV